MSDEFKTAEELEITNGERKWLIEGARFLEGMEADTKTPLPDGTLFRFDMSDTLYDDHKEDAGGHPVKCGTAGCILGLCWSLAIQAGDPIFGREDYPSAEFSETLESLFYPDGVDYDQVTPKIAAETTLGFLRTGKITYPEEVKYAD